MSLQLLRPVLWSARQIPRTHLCASLNKQHLLSAYQKSCKTNLCSAQALYTTAASSTLETQESSDKTLSNNNGIMSKIQQAKTAEDLLETVKDIRLSPSEVTFALNMLEEQHDSTKSKVQQFSKDERLVKMLMGLTNKRNVKKLGSRWLLKSLTNPYVRSAKNKQALMDAIVPALRSKLRAMDVLTLSKLVYRYEMLSYFKQTEDLVKEAARVLELRRREMDELTSATLIRLLGVVQHFPHSFKTFITDKVLESLDKFSFADLEATMSLLVKLHFRSPALLKAITYQALQQRTQWTLDSVLRFLASFGSLNFYSQPVTQQMADFILGQDTEWTPSSIGLAAMSFRVLRMHQPDLFDCLADYTLNHLDDFNHKDLHKVLYAFGELGYQPNNKKAFYDKIAAKLESEFSSYSMVTKLQLASALMLSDQVPMLVLKDLLQPKEDMTDTKEKRSEFLDILLMQLNTHARLSCPDYDGPYLESPPRIQASNTGQTELEKSVVNTLQLAVGGDDKFLKTGVWTNLGYKLGALVLMDEHNKPVVIDDYQLPDLQVHENDQQKIAVPPQYHRIAVLIWSPKDMLFDKDKVMGRLKMQKKHLELAGYRVVEVNFKQWNTAKTDFQKLSLINMKLTEAMAGGKNSV